MPASESTYHRFMESSFKASTLKPRSETAPSAATIANIQVTIDESLAFCEKECFALLIQSFGNAPAISNGASLANVACSDRAFPQQSAFDLIAERPPVPLTEPYYKCHNTWQTAVSQGIGIANGFTLASISLFGLFVFPLIVSIMDFFGYIEKKSILGDEYDAADRAMAIDELALQILRVRDSNTRGISPGGEIEKLAQDLVRTASSTAQINSVEGSGTLGQAENYAQPDVDRHLKTRPSASMFLDLEDFEENAAACYPNYSSVSSKKGVERGGRGGIAGVSTSTRNPIGSKIKINMPACVQTDKL
jgi:hypothetical protein